MGTKESGGTHVWPRLGGRLLDSGFLAVLLTASLVLNIVLASHIRALRSRSNPVPVKGISISSVLTNDPDGAIYVIDFADTDKSTVLYVLRPDCLWCARNLNNVQALVKARSASFRFIGLSLSSNGVKEYVRANSLGFPVYSVASTDIVQALHLGNTPQTIVVTSRGKVIQDWIGAYLDTNQSGVENFFKVKLPGLKTDGTTPLSFIWPIQGVGVR